MHHMRDVIPMLNSIEVQIAICDVRMVMGLLGPGDSKVVVVIGIRVWVKGSFLP